MLLVAEAVRVDAAADPVVGLEDVIGEVGDLEAVQDHGNVQACNTCTHNADLALCWRLAGSPWHVVHFVWDVLKPST